MVKMDTSKVPPPRSKIRTFFSPLKFLSKPYARAAAVGSFMILKTLIPKIVKINLIFLVSTEYLQLK